MEYSKIIIEKNRGWRGLAEVDLTNDDGDIIKRLIFSFSQPVWEDMLKGFIVTQTKDDYVIIEFNNLDALPKPTQQRSVLIKHFEGNIIDIHTYSKRDWLESALYKHMLMIHHFKNNKNNHTTSDWNCVGIRVVPMI